MAILKKKIVAKADAPEPEAKGRKIKAPPKVGTRTQGPMISVIKTEKIDVAHLQRYYKNPRVGNVDEIAKSLHTNGQFKAIVVNMGTKTGRKYEVLAGNHTFLGAKKVLDWQQDGRHMHKDAWTQVLASFVDVTNEEAARIVLADNKTSDQGTYNDQMLAELFAQLPSTVGTGYTQEEMDSIVASLPVEADEVVVKTLEEFKAAMPELDLDIDNRVGGGDVPSSSKNGHVEFSEADLDDDYDEEAEEKIDPEEMQVDEVSVQLQATLQLRETQVQNGSNAWGVPELREDMLLRVEDVKDLRSWVDRDLTPDDGKSTYFANFASGSRKGMPFDRSILAFFNEDAQFDMWYTDPAWHATKFTMMGFNKAVVPDYSLYGDSARAVHMFQVYKAMWIGRFLQDAGWRVAPRLQFCATDPDTMDIALLGHPVGLPVLVLGAQTFGAVDVEGEGERAWQQQMSYAVNKLDPEVVIAYTGIPGKKLVETTNFGKWKGQIRYIETVSTIRNRARDAKFAEAKKRKARVSTLKKKLAAESEAK